MDVASEIVLRLADPVARPSVLTAEALLAIATVAYELDPALVTEPATATFDRFDLAVPLGARVSALAQFRRTGEPVPWEVSASWDTGQAPPAAADAVWTGAVVVRTARPGGTIVDVTTEESEVDSRIALGTTVAMSPPEHDPAPVPVPLPVLVAFLAADATTSPRDLLRATAVARLGAARYAAADVPRGAPDRRFDRLVCWVVPDPTFDDPGWSGAQSDTTPEQRRADRLRAARGWLAGQGVAVITFTEPT
ncbi:hypothetical protein [Amycolatopsis vancoresmycina]|uniref:Uncharacterized protein n=1 Tax=Amycolatopsis vancoresmycina DSM 44592 TaxID=1292037 RepID=R1GAD1_9PSEU|nr:hypothetical protein [Amycolatopsis vancoresmycina]EOD68318.1 hypothetical protein H480_11937 [Amycolatopsis vancoresmycina DSM 44592]